MRDTLRHFVAEFVGIFGLVFVGGGAIMSAAGSGGGLLQVALAHGIALAIMVSATMRISGGHLNPAITIGFLVTRRIEPFMAGVHIVAQLLGATLAAYALKALMPSAIFDAAHGGGQAVAMDITGLQAIGLEAVATFFLAFVVFGTAVDPKAPRIGGLAIGLTIAGDILAIGPFTGGSMNPGRSFGPALASGSFEGLLIYFVGPILGAVAAALVYDRIFLREEP
jgi:MIP family channel proteins